MTFPWAHPKTKTISIIYSKLAYLETREGLVGSLVLQNFLVKEIEPTPLQETINHFMVAFRDTLTEHFCKTNL